MYAIVEIAGQQFKVEKGQEIYVHRLESSEGEKVQFDSVMMIDNNGKLNIGTPVISGAQVTATVVEHMKGDKVFIFHKKRRKGYQKFNGHREYLSLIKIDEIIESGATPAKKEEKKKTEAAPKKKPAAKKKAAPAKKETVAKKTTPAKKAVAKADDKKDKPKADTTEKKKEAATKPSAKKSVEKKEEKKADAGTSKEVKSAKKEEAPKKEDSGDSKEEKK